MRRVIIMMLVLGCAVMTDVRGDGLFLSLASSPRPSGCNDSRCAELDLRELYLYTDARSGTISWVQLVERYYSALASYFPDMYDEDMDELMHYQRELAVQMDSQQMTEKEWVRLIDKKGSEIRRARNKRIEDYNQRIQDSRPIIIQNSPPIHRSTNCTTTEFMGRYQTHCD